MHMDTIPFLKERLDSRNDLKLCILHNNLLEVLTRVSDTIKPNIIFMHSDSFC